MAMLKPLVTHLHRSRGLCSAVEDAAAFQVIPFSPTAVQEDVVQNEEDWTFIMCQRWNATSGMGCFFLATKRVHCLYYHPQRLEQLLVSNTCRSTAAGKLCDSEAPLLDWSKETGVSTNTTCGSQRTMKLL